MNLLYKKFKKERIQWGVGDIYVGERDNSRKSLITKGVHFAPLLTEVVVQLKQAHFSFFTESNSNR